MTRPPTSPTSEQGATAMSDQPAWTAIDRYLVGEAAPEEARAVEAWAAAAPEHAALLDALRADGTPATRESAWDADAAWARLAPRLAATGAVRSTPAPTRGLAWRLAAGVLLAAGLGAAGWRVATRAGDAPATELAAAPGRRVTGTLADGSRVTLNAGSRLRWRADYGRGAREVELEGEGWFEVAHDARRPFRVRARGAVAEDLGTRFVVRAYPELARVEVAVAEGRVALHPAGGAAPALLDAGDVGRAEGARATVVARGVTGARVAAWTAGVLAFDGRPLGEALPELSRWYDVEVVAPDPRLAARPLVARFDGGRVEAALDAIALALDARWTRRGRTVTLEPRP
jgi:transmembrane sensor